MAVKGTTSQNPGTTGIHIDVPVEHDDLLEAWAGRDHRSKREHVLYLVQEILEAYKADPFVMHRLALGRSVAGRATA